MHPRVGGSGGSGSRSRACPLRGRHAARFPSPRWPRTARPRRRGDGPPRGRRRALACRGRPPPTRPSPRRTARARFARHGVDQLAVGRGREREAKRAGEPFDCLDGTVDEREIVRIPRLHPPDDLVVDLVRRARQPDRRRACSATTRSSSCPSCPPARARASVRHGRVRAPRAPRPTRARSRRARRRGRRRPRRSRSNAGDVIGARCRARKRPRRGPW